MTFYRTLLAATLLTGFALPAAAQQEQPQQAATAQKEKEARNWDLALAFAVGTRPEYLGAAGNEMIALPFAIASYRFNDKHEIFFRPGDWLGYAYHETDNLSYGINSNYRKGRDDTDDPSLNGMDDIDPTFEAGPWIGYKFTQQLSLKAQLHWDTLNEHNGMVGKVALNYRLPLENKRWQSNLGTHLVYGNSNYMDRYFNVTQAQATSTRPEFDSGAGFHQAGVAANVMYFFNQNWFARTDAVFNRLFGDANNSPLVKEDDQFTGFLSVGYKF